MATKLHDGLTWSERVTPGEKLRLVLKFDVLEYAVDLLHWEKFPARVAQWWEATNGRGVLVIAAPEVKPEGNTAVVDVQVTTLAPIPTYMQLVGFLDDLVPAVDVVDVYKRPSGTAFELAQGRLALLEEKDVTLASKVGGAIQAAARPVVDVVVLVVAIGVLALISGWRRK